MQKKVASGLVIIYILLLLPVLYIGRYNYHCADDFGFSAASHVAWENTHSMVNVIQAAGETVVDRWHTWQGTFTTMFLMAIEPGIFGDNYYHLVPWLMIGGMTLSTMYILYILLVELIGCGKSTWISITIIYLIYAFECMISPLQAFFWYNGATHYMIPHSLALLLIGMIVKSKISEKKFLLIILSCIIAFLIGGGNYITALSTGVGFVYVILVCIFLKRNIKNWLCIVPFFSYLPAFLLNIFASGNSVRQEAFINHPGPIKAIMLAFYYCVKRTLEDWLDWKVMVFVLLLAPLVVIVVEKIKERFNFQFRYPLLVIVLSFCFLSAMFAPTAYASGEIGGGRVENIIFLDYLLFIIVNEIYIVGWLDKKLQLIDKIALWDIENRNGQLFYIFVLSFTLFFTGLTVLKEDNSYTTSSAVISIFNGEAARYGKETANRTKLIENSGSYVLELPRFEEMPYLLYMDDIVSDSDDWRNNAMERYYGIKEIVAFSPEGN